MKITNKTKYIITAVITVIIVISGTAGSVSDKFSWDKTYKKAGLQDSNVSSDYPLSVHFIDVGQGDCIFIKYDGCNILIDAGEKGNETAVTEYLEKLGVKTIDYVIPTHPHSDHIGGLPGVIEKFTVKNVIMTRFSKENMPTTATYEKLLDAVSSSGANVIEATVGNTITCSDLSFTILSPIKQYDDYNDMSIVIRLTYKDVSFLFTGDAESEAEKDILASGENVSANVLKVGHHGSSTSTCDDFLEDVSPDYAVIMCGTDNEYGHPHKQTLDRLSALNIKVFRTDTDGTVFVGTDGKTLAWGNYNADDN